MSLVKTVPYVLHEHLAKRAGRHYDLRIKYPTKNKLASWALTKGVVPKIPGEKYLAVRTPDHDMRWMSFEGEIPDGEYGAGEIKIVQSGDVFINAWYPTRLIIFTVSGVLLDGKYTLFVIKKTAKQENWNIIKNKDKETL